MNKADVIHNIHVRTEIDPRQVAKVLTALSIVVSAELQANETVVLPHLGRLVPMEGGGGGQEAETGRGVRSECGLTQEIIQSDQSTSRCAKPISEDTMADDGQSQAANVLYLAFCDAHGRASDGTPLIAGRSFSAPNGYPALTWGCGPLYHVNPDAPRWLVLSEARVTLETSCPRVFEAAIVYDGPRTDALRYLHDHGAAGMPYLGRRRSGR